MLEFYSFDNFNKFYVVPILLGFMLLANAMVYFGLLPSRSKVRFEDPTNSSDSPSKRQVITMEPDFLSPSVLNVSKRDNWLNREKQRWGRR